MRTPSSTPATTPPVLVAVDGSAAALHALTWPAQDAVGRQAGLRIAAGLSRAVLLTRARMAGDVDVKTASLPEPGCALPASCFSRAMVVLAPERRRRVSAVLDRPVLSAATSATFVSRRHAISERLREGSR